MNYEPDEWLALCQEVESQKGAVAPPDDYCLGHAIKYNIPATKKSYQIKSCNCRNPSMLVTRYTPSDDKDEAKELQSRGSGFARVCGVCDNVGMWPRFHDALENA